MSEPSPSDAPAKPRGHWPKLIAVLALAAALLVSVRFIRLSLSTEKTDDAFITGRVHRISAGVAGNLLTVNVQDNQQVKAGEILAKIDPLEFEIMAKQAAAALEQAKAKVAEVQANLARARSADLQADAAIAMANAEIQQRQSVLDLARTVQKRNESLVHGDTRALSVSELDNARSAAAAAEAALAGATAQLASARAGKESNASAIAVAQAQIASARADIDARQASIQEACRQRDLTEIISPVGGRIGNRNAESGNRVQAGQPLFALVEDDYWIVGNFKETQLKEMRVGQAVDIFIDALGGRHFTGRVDSIAPSTGAQFALLPPDNATGNFTKVVQRVPVKITFDPASIRGFEDSLRPGLSTVVRVKL